MCTQIQGTTHMHTIIHTHAQEVGKESDVHVLTVIMNINNMAETGTLGGVVFCLLLTKHNHMVSYLESIYFSDCMNIKC